MLSAGVSWVGKHIFHLDLSGAPSAIEDIRQDLVLLFCYVGITIIVTLIWTLLDKRSQGYPRLQEWLRIYLRYAVAVAMLVYGIDKLIPNQFGGSLNLLRATHPLGDFSLEALFWTFMAVSKPYTVFAGAVEVLGGMLLFFRRTATLGALIVFAAMLNVAMLNFSYEIPVKLYSSHLVLFALFLLIPDLRRLIRLLVLNRSTMPVKQTSLFRTRSARIGSRVIKFGFMAYVIFTITKVNVGFIKTTLTAPRSPLYGIYTVEEFVKNGHPVPPLTTDRNRWEMMIFQTPSTMSLKLMDDSVRPFHTQFNQAKSIIDLSDSDDKNQKYTFGYTRPDADHLVLQGAFDNDLLIINARRIDQMMPLITNGFHWIHPCVW